MIEVDFKIAHHSIFTNTKLMKMKLIDYEECEICENEIESITHLFISCEQLVEFHQHILFENCNSDKMTLVVYEEIFMFGLTNTMKGVNVIFLNFMLSIAKYCVLRRRNLVKNGQNNIDLIRLFSYTYNAIDVIRSLLLNYLMCYILKTITPFVSCTIVLSDRKFFSNTFLISFNLHRYS
jgi:hypothetical protein